MGAKLNFINCIYIVHETDNVFVVPDFRSIISEGRIEVCVQNIKNTIIQSNCHRDEQMFFEWPRSFVGLRTT